MFSKSFVTVVFTVFARIVTVHAQDEDDVNKIEFVTEEIKPNYILLTMKATGDVNDVVSIDIDVSITDMVSHKGQLARLVGSNHTFIIGNLQANTYYGMAFDGTIDFESFKRKHIQYIFVHTPDHNYTGSTSDSGLMNLTSVGSLLTGDVLVRMASYKAKQIELSNRVTLTCKSKNIMGPSVELNKFHTTQDIYFNKSNSEYDLPEGFPGTCSYACVHPWIMFIDPAQNSLHTFKAPVECTKIKLVYKRLEDLDHNDLKDPEENCGDRIRVLGYVIVLLAVFSIYL